MKEWILSHPQAQYQTFTELRLHKLLRITDNKKKIIKFILSFHYSDSIWYKYGDILLSQKNRNCLAGQQFQSLGYGSYFTLRGGKDEAKAGEVR